MYKDFREFILFLVNILFFLCYLVFFKVDSIYFKVGGGRRYND